LTSACSELWAFPRMPGCVAGVLIQHSCRYDHQLRPTAKEAMMHPFFAPVVEFKAKEAKKKRAEAATAPAAGAGGES